MRGRRPVRHAPAPPTLESDRVAYLARHGLRECGACLWGHLDTVPATAAHGRRCRRRTDLQRYAELGVK